MATGQGEQVTRSPGVSPGPPDGRAGLPAALRRLDPVVLAPAVVTLAVMLWGMATPSYWRDESATISAVGRPLPQLVRMLGRVDAVHGLYYLLMWPVAHLTGTREFATRLPSAVAMAAAAAGVAAIGARLRSRRAGLYAGLVFAVLPLVTVRGHDARPYAFETAAAVLATWLLLRAAQQPTWRRFGWYGASLVLLGYLHLFGLLILLPHAVALVPAAGPGSGPRPARGPLLWRWLVSCAAALAAVAPVAWLGWQQRQAIGWLTPPTGHDVVLLVAWFAAGTVTSALVFAALIALGAVRADWPDPFGRAGLLGPASAAAAAPLAAWAGRRERVLTAVALPWLVLPPAALLIAAQFKPVYELMYLEYCLPAVALLVGAGIAALGWPLRFAALGLVVVLGLPAQVALRQPLAGGYLRSTAQFLAAHEQPGDAVYYPGRGGVPSWDITYPAGFGGLREIQLGQTAVRARQLSGTSLPASVVEQRLHGVRRLWLVEMSNAWVSPPFPLRPGFRLALSWQRNQMWVRLYVRSGDSH